MNFYGVLTLRNELAKRGLPNSRPFLNALEKKGIISRPSNNFKFHERTLEYKLQKSIATEDVRIYTLEEIENICNLVAKYKNK